MKLAQRYSQASSILAVVLLLAGCSFSVSTANISDFVISKVKDGPAATGNFAPSDAVFAKTVISNSPGKVTVKFHLVAEKVDGKPEHTVLPEGELSYDLPSDGNVKYSLTPPPGGWPAGTYMIQTSMLDENGTEKDKRSGTFTVAGTSASPAPPQANAAPAAGPTGDNASTASGVEFKQPEFSDSKHGDSYDVFAPDTPKIFSRTYFKGVAKGSEIKVEWFAEKTDGAPPNKKLELDGNEMAIGENYIDSTLPSPPGGWPTGTYRVDVSLNGKTITSAHFDVEK